MTDPLSEHVDDLVARGVMEPEAAAGIKETMPQFDFDTGSSAQNNITGSCRECQNGRHTECLSLREEFDPWPYINEDGNERFDHNSSWICPCLEDAERREDHAKHGSYE